jgi:PAS domain-containing protein
MEKVEQLRQWRTELEQLREALRTSIQAKDRSDVEEELQTCIESLEHNGSGPVAVPPSPQSFRRSVDLIAGPYLETDAACIIRRTNKAFLSLMNLDLTRRIVGTPLLLFIARGDRERFVTEFLKLAGRDGLYLAQITARVQPDFDDAVWMRFEGHRVEGQHRQLLGLVWMLKAAEAN